MRELCAKGSTAMVGDGINDAPAHDSFLAVLPDGKEAVVRGR